MEVAYCKVAPRSCVVGFGSVGFPTAIVDAFCVRTSGVRKLTGVCECE